MLARTTFMFRCLLVAAIASSVSSVACGQTGEEKEELISTVEDPAKLDGAWRLSQSVGGVAEDKPEKIKTFLEQLGAPETVVHLAKTTGKNFYADLFYRWEHQATDKTHYDQAIRIFASSRNTRVIQFSVDRETSFTASMHFYGDDDSVTIRYPENCCSRSGLVLNFERKSP